MENDSVCNKGIVLELSLKSSSMMEHDSTTKPCTLNLDPYLKLALSNDHVHTKNKKPACDHGSLHRQDSVSGGGVRVVRDREVRSEEPIRRVISTTSEVEDDDADEDSSSVNGRKKLRLTKAQSALLEESFNHQSTLNPKRKHELARELKLRPRQVEVWFQNRRARTKLKQTELECEDLKKCCEVLKEENTRLQKELQELKQQSTEPPHLQVPVATLTTCLSCKRVGDIKSAVNNLPFTMATKPHFFNPFSNPHAAR